MRWFGITLALLALLAVHSSAFPRVRRDAELQENENLSPLSEHLSDEDEDREKRELEAAEQAKYGVKNAILGFVFGGSGAGPKSSLTSTSRLSQPPAPPKPRPTSRPKPSTTTEDIPVFDRNRVSLAFPGNLFGPSVSLLLKSTKIVGSVIQNSATRYQSFLRLFRPLFKGAFEIKGLDPITTTRAPSTTAEAASSATTISNEIRRR